MENKDFAKQLEKRTEIFAISIIKLSTSATKSAFVRAKQVKQPIGLN